MKTEFQDRFQIVAKPEFWFGLMLLAVSLLDMGEIKVIRVVDVFAIIAFLLLVKEKIQGSRELVMPPKMVVISLVGLSLTVILAYAHSFFLPFESGIPGAVGAKAPYIRGFVQLGKLFFALIMFYWMTFNIIRSYEQLVKYLWIVVLGSFVVTVFGLYLDIGYLFGFDTKQLFTEAIWFVPRLYGSGKEPLFFADYLVYTVPLTCFLMIQEKEKVKRSLLWLIFTLQVLAMVLTFSAGGWIGLFAGVTVLFCLGLDYLHKVKKMLLYSGVVVLIALALVQSVYPKLYVGFVAIAPKITTMFGIDTSSLKYGASIYSASDREILGKTGLKVFAKHPLIGVGIGNFAFHFNQNRPEGVKRYNFVTIVNNQYIEILAETGIIGFAFYMTFIISQSYRGLAVIRSLTDSQIKNVLIFILSACIGILVQYLSFSSTPLNYFWISMGLLTAGIMIAEDSKVQVSKEKTLGEAIQ